MKVAKKMLVDNAVKFEFADGTIITCDVTGLDAAMVDRLALHGIAQKVGDSYASAQTVSEAIHNAKETWKNLVEGVWATRAGTGGKLAEALSRHTGKALDDCITLLAGMDKKAKADLQKHPQIKLELANMAAEEAARLATGAAANAGASLEDMFK